MTKSRKEKIVRFEHLAEITTWLVMILVLLFIRFLPQPILEQSTVYIFIGVIISAALIYYWIIYRYFPRTQRLYIKDISDIILIGILIHLAKDYGIYFFALYFLPIMAAALVLETINSLLIATVACLFVAAEIILESQGLAPPRGQFYLGIWQIFSILIITLFARFLALQIRHEKEIKEAAIREKIKAHELERMQKEFTAQSAHQLFTPLSIARGNLSLLLNEDVGKINAKQRDFLQTVYLNIKKMIGLVSDLLSISRLEEEKVSLKLQKTDLIELIKKILKQFYPQARIKNLHLIFRKPLSRIAKIKVDREKIEQVIINLLDNALKYTQKGRVVVGIKKDPVGQQVIVKVEDTGVGIPRKEQAKLFTRFFRGSNILEIDPVGTGLGLSIAKILVESHNGKIWAESEENKGSTFYFSLPMK